VSGDVSGNFATYLLASLKSGHTIKITLFSSGKVKNNDEDDTSSNNNM
jgi:hypothetical protein